MRARITRCLATALLLFVVSPLQAEEFDVTISLRGDTPIPVLFLKCARNFDVAGTEEAPAGCRQREADQTFSTTVARITNVGSSIVWIHIGRARLPVLPGKVFRHRRVGKRTFDRIFLSGEPGGMAHVFVADPVQDEPEIKAPKESERPKQGERIEKD